MTSTSMQNKTRGRAFQTKLAQMSGGINIGTLGGEDVMHKEFSYEAKTYKKNCKSHNGRDWKGEQMLQRYDDGLASVDLAIVHVSSSYYSPLIMLRWTWWERIAESRVSIDDIKISMHFDEATKFIGNTYMNQAEKNCPDAKLPVVVVHTVGKRHKQDIVLLRADYWNSLLENYGNLDIDK